MTEDYLVELDVITSILLREKGRLEGSHDGKGSAANSSFPWLDLVGSSPVASLQSQGPLPTSNISLMKPTLAF